MTTASEAMQTISRAQERVDTGRVKLGQIQKELDQILARNDHAVRNITGGDAERFANLSRGYSKTELDIEEAMTEWRNAVAIIASNPNAIEHGDGAANIDATRADRGPQVPEYDRARRNVDAAVRAGHLPDHAAQKVATLLEDGPTPERSLAAQWAAAAGDPVYRTCFAKLLADPTRGHLLWTAQEAAAYRAVAEVQNVLERTAMSTTGANGGYMIPLTLDPSIMLTNDGSNNPLRRLARVVQTTTNAWAGVTSAGATSEWKTEGAEAADGSPTLAQPSVPVFLGDSFVPYSFEVGMDASNFLSELTDVLVDSADNLMATAYTTGTGSGQPQGIVTGLAGTSSEINTTGSEAIDATDPFVLQNALPARFSANAVFMSHIAIANGYRQFETTNGALKFPELRESPPRLLGKAWHENSNMDGAINAAATANNYVLIYGDIAKCFVVVDRVGTTLELIPNLLGANGRPTGQRGALLWFRTGSEVVIPQAARLLDVPTAA